MVRDLHVPSCIAAHYASDWHGLDVGAPFVNPATHGRVQRYVFDLYPKLAWAWLRNGAVFDSENVARQRPGSRAAGKLHLAVGVGHRFSPMVVVQGSGLSTFLADLVLHNACFVFVVRKVSAEVFSVSSSRGASMQNRWGVLALLFAVRTTMAVQFQSIAAMSPIIMQEFGIALADIGLLIGLYLAPGIVIALPGGEIGRRFGDKQ